MRQRFVFACAGIVLLGLAWPASADDSLSGLKSTDSAALGDIRGSVVVREKPGATGDQAGQSKQGEGPETDAFVSAEEALGGPDRDVSKDLGASGAGLTSGLGGAFGAVEGLSAPVARSVDPTGF